MPGEDVLHPLVERTASHIRSMSAGDATGHDWWHTRRVWRLARSIGRTENSDPLVTELGALLHDVHDWKSAGGSTDAGAEAARSWLESLGAPAGVIAPVAEIVRHVSFKGAGVPDAELPLEGMVVRDADRLDAMGAVGIARAFAYGGAAGRLIHNPEYTPEHHATFAAYRTAGGGSRSHFDEKLLLLEKRMHTAEGRRIAAERHAFMLEFLRHFDAEWAGEGV